jgi:hypothetical protein
MDVPRKSAVLAGVAGLGLVALGWWIVGWHDDPGWGRLTDLRWWLGGTVRGLGYLTIGKVGFKVAMALVLGGVVVVRRVRGRRAESAATPAEEEHGSC